MAEKFDLGVNVEAVVDGNILTLRIDLSKDFGRSASGKTTVIASTKGNQQIIGNPAIIGLNVYKK